MLSRMIAVIICSWLPALGLILPVSAAYRTNALVAGGLATLLAGLTLVDNRARYGAAVLGAWVSFMPFVFTATLLEIVLNVGWGVAMFTFLIGPFSASPVVTWTRPATVKTETPEHEPSLPFRAAA